MTSSDSESDEVVFLTPEESDQGASPTLRRSGRKRKSVCLESAGRMSNNSASKKKKNSPDPGRSMPRLPRTPQGAAPSADQQGPDQGQGQGQAKPPSELCLLYTSDAADE